MVIESFNRSTANEYQDDTETKVSNEIEQKANKEVIDIDTSKAIDVEINEPEVTPTDGEQIQMEGPSF